MILPPDPMSERSIPIKGRPGRVVSLFDVNGLCRFSVYRWIRTLLLEASRRQHERAPAFAMSVTTTPPPDAAAA
jgi:hypothetical protein